MLGRVALAVRNNAKNVYALVPTLFNDDNGEVMSSDIAGSKQLLEDAMRESGEDEDWHEGVRRFGDVTIGSGAAIPAGRPVEPEGRADPGGEVGER